MGSEMDLKRKEWTDSEVEHKRNEWTVRWTSRGRNGQ